MWNYKMRGIGEIMMSHTLVKRYKKKDGRDDAIRVDYWKELQNEPNKPKRQKQGPTSLLGTVLSKTNGLINKGKISSGSFGEVFWIHRSNKKDDEKDFACKHIISSKETKKYHPEDDILREMQLYHLFSKSRIGPNIPYQISTILSFDEISSFHIRNSFDKKGVKSTEGLIFMEKFDCDLWNYMEIISKKMLKIIRRDIHFKDDKQRQENVRKARKRHRYLLSIVAYRIDEIITTMMSQHHIYCHDVKGGNFLVHYISSSLIPTKIVMTDFGALFCCSETKSCPLEFFDPNRFEYKFVRLLLLISFDCTLINNKNGIFGSQLREMGFFIKYHETLIEYIINKHCKQFKMDECLFYAPLYYLHNYAKKKPWSQVIWRTYEIKGKDGKPEFVNTKNMRYCKAQDWIKLFKLFLINMYDNIKFDKIKLFEFKNPFNRRLYPNVSYSPYADSPNNSPMDI